MLSLCQEHSTEVLHCPADSKRNSQGAGYTTMADLLEGFAKISCLPRKMNLARFDEGEGIEATLRRHKAKWHDSCRLENNKTQLLCSERKKRLANQTEEAEKSKKLTRLSTGKASSISDSTSSFVPSHLPQVKHCARHPRLTWILELGSVR